jgi:hypothetical protein
MKCEALIIRAKSRMLPLAPLASIAGLCLALLALYVPVLPDTLGWIGIVCCVLSLPSLRSLNWPLALVLRIALLAAPGILTGVLLLFYGSEVTIMVHAVEYGTPRMATKILLLTALGLNSSVIAWHMAVARPVRIPFSLPYDSSALRFWLYALMAIGAGTLTAMALGPYVWTAAYGSESSSLFLGIATIPAIAVIGIVGMYSLLLSKTVSRKYWPYFWLIASYTLLHCMLLRGMRLEVFAVGLAMYAGYKMRTKQDLRPIRILSAMVVLYGLGQVFGSIRSVAGTHMNISEYLSFALEYAYEGNVVPFFPLGTLADIAATFYNTVGLVDGEIVGPMLGLSYLNYIPRTLPEVLYPGRPLDLSFVFSEYGLTSGGGFFEMAEAYINFGALGCVVIPGAITYILAQVSLNAQKRPGFTSMILYLIIISLCLRGIWYQTFAIYKAGLTWIMLELLMMLCIAVVDNPGRAKKTIRC